MADVPVIPAAAAPAVSRVFIRNLNYSTSWEALKDICAKEVGAVNYVRIPLRQGRPSGTAIIEFPTAELAQRAIETLNDIEIDGRRIYVKHDDPPRRAAPVEGAEGAAAAAPAPFARAPRAPRSAAPGAPRQSNFNEDGRKKTAGEDNTSIFLSGLPFSASWQDLKDLCRPYGTVLYADIFMNQQRQSRGVGVVRFSEQDAVATAIEALNGSDMRGRKIAVRKYEPRAPGAGAEAAAPATEAVEDVAIEGGAE